MDMIEKLRTSSPEKRVDLISRLYEKNRDFFKRKVPSVHRFLEQTACPYHIDLTENFFNIIHSPTGTVAHPEAGLDSFADMMGEWIHPTWVDLFNFRVVTSETGPEHFAAVTNFNNVMTTAFPESMSRFTHRLINLKELKDGRRFSPPVVFLGIFHGLHIAKFLERTNVTTILLIEPEPERFEVSCYFLDYTQIYDRIPGQVCLALGDDEKSAAIEQFFSPLTITPHMWTRILPGYAYEKANVFVDSLKAKQTQRSDIVFPFDFELHGLRNGMKNLNNGMPLLSRQPKLPHRAKIAVVATGPSLENDIQWLKDNQGKLIIFSAHSAVSVLRTHGIIPDFQFGLDTRPIEPELVTKLELFKDRPFIGYYKMNEHFVAATDSVLLVSEQNKPNSVRFSFELEHTHPTTATLAFAFACACAPGEIYLLGCDSGYRSVNRIHAASSSFYDAEEVDEHETGLSDSTQILLPANLYPGEYVQSTTYFVHAALSMEAAITTLSSRTKVINLSDGVRIRGAVPRFSKKVKLRKYKKNKKDLAAIHNSFRPAKQGMNWFVYPVAGEKRLEDIKEIILATMTLERFKWADFCVALDKSLIHMSDYCKEKNDIRIDVYTRVFADLLSSWYNQVIFLDDRGEAEKAYLKGLATLEEIFKTIHWPRELDIV